MVDFLFHDISDRGLHSKLVASGGAVSLVDGRDVERSLALPPFGTRARLRSEVIARCRQVGARVVADWSMCKVALPNTEWATVSLADPFVSRDPGALRSALPMGDNVERTPATA
jgi:hypothetical protein